MKTLRLTVFFSAVFLAGFVNAQTGEIFYYPKSIKTEPNNAKVVLAGLIKSTSWGKPDNVIVLDNRIDITFKGKKKAVTTHSIYFSEMADHPVGVTRTEVVPVVKAINATITFYNYVIRLKDCNLFAKDVYSYFFYRDDLPASPITLADTYYKQNVPESETNYKILADYLFFFQHPFMIQRYDSLLARFKPIAEMYSALTVKPAVSEQQRKYIVQANAMNQNKDYDKAIELYNKALELDQTAYPGAYSNLALLSAQIQNYEGAIFYMKKYLLLEAEPSEARSAQDKIYEWEALTAR